MGTLLVRDCAAEARGVRDNLAAALADRVAPDSLDDVLLVATELVSNAVRHGGAGSGAGRRSRLDVTWRLDHDAVVIAVRDPSRALPKVRPLDVFRTGGRGLAIVSAIASDWGVRRLRTGKQVWARVPVQRLS